MLLMFYAGYLLGTQKTAYQGSTEVLAAAVHGKEGVLIKIRVDLKPGSGNVFVNARVKTGYDTQASAENAVRAASKFVDLSHTDVFITLEGASFAEGPSAGAAMAVAIVAAAMGKEMPKDVVITGEIDPSGKILPVGGLYEKVKACAEAGVKKILVPRGQSRVTVWKKRVVRREVLPGIFVEEVSFVPEEIDLNSLGVKVVEVSSLEEALREVGVLS